MNSFIDIEQKPRLVFAAVLACSLIAAVIWGFDAYYGYEQFLHPGAHSDFVNLGIFMEKMDNPELYPRDYLHASPDTYRYYTPSYRWLLKILSFITGDWRSGLLVLVPILGFLFVATTAFWLRLFSRSLFVVCVLALTASIPHFLPGFDAWGSGGIANALPRTVFASVASLVLLVYIKKAGTISGAYWSLGLTGLATNLHPVTGCILGQVLLADLTIYTIRRRLSFLGLPIAAGAYVIGAAPFLFTFFMNRSQSAGAVESVDPSFFWAAVQVRFPKTIFPPDLSDSWMFLEAVLPILVFAILGIAMRGLGSRVSGEAQGDDRPNAVRGTLQLVGVVLLVVFGGQIIFQFLARKTGWTLMTLDQFRGLRLIYPLLFGLAAAGLDDLRLKIGRWRGYAIVVVAAILMIPVIRIPQISPTMMYMPRPVKILYYGLTGRSDQIPVIKGQIPISEKKIAFKEAAQWARENTPSHSLFLTDDSRFRLFSERSIAFGFKDGGVVYYLGHGPFLEWARREKLIAGARSSKRPESWIELAHSLECDYVVVKMSDIEGNTSMTAAKSLKHENPNETHQLDGKVVFQNSVYVIFSVKGQILADSIGQES